MIESPPQINSYDQQSYVDFGDELIMNLNRSKVSGA